MITYFKDIAIIENDLISGWIKQHGRLDFDNNSLPQLLKYLNHGDVVIDAGSYIGDTTLAFAKAVGTEGSVWSYEPNPIAFQAQQHNMKNYPQVKSYNLALSYCGDKNNYIIDYNTENVGASFLTKKEKGSSFSTCIDSIPLIRLNFIKIDAEGFEVNILEGGKETIEKFKPIIVLEINKGALARNSHTPQMIFDFLDKMNYFYRNIYVKEPMAGEQYDIIAFHKSKQ